jgi:pantoate--beta-alanine ligase
LKLQSISNVSEISRIIVDLKQQGKTIGFVPTMGALHPGHISLIEKARSENDIVVCSIFVNPTQFNDPKDLEKYPRMPEKDLAMLDEAGCNLAFLPGVEDIYPSGNNLLDIHFGKLEETMEGAFRPGHFSGVATVVDRLFKIVNANKAYFGEKDFQQLAIIRRMAHLLNHPTEVIGCPTLREPDGLAMSSRNLLLTPEQRKVAPLIYKAMQQAEQFIPTHSPAAIIDLVIRFIEQSKLLRVQYFQLVDPTTLEDITSWENVHEVRGCIAVLTEGSRLIDNIAYTLDK